MLIDDKISLDAILGERHTEQDFINLRQWARKKALEMFAGTETGKNMARLTHSKKLTTHKRR